MVNNLSNSSKTAAAHSKWEICIDLLSGLVDKENVTDDPKTLARYALALNGSICMPAAVVYPTSEDQVVALVKLANRQGLTLYPLSRGKNFGYGTAQGTSPGQVVVDLSRMDRIVEVNEALGYAILQPGVTQQQLCNYLQEKSSRLQMDVTGGGKQASVVGNVLERGFGHTDYGNRSDSILGIHVVLPQGKKIETGFQGFPEAQAAHTYRHGIGPSVDGLFTQSNLGIVTQMTLALQPRPEHHCMFAFLARDDEALEPLIARVRELRLAGVVTSAVHMANAGRLKKPGRKNNMGAWNLSGVLGGPNPLVKAKRKQIKQAFKGIPGRLYFLTERKLHLLGWVHRHVKPIAAYEDLREIMYVKQGIPTERYIKDLMGNEQATSDTLNTYAKDQCFRWISAVVPADSNKVREMVGLTETCMVLNGYRFRATLTFVTPRTVILVSEFSYPNHPAVTEKAKKDYEECVQLLAEAGYYAYRSGPGSYEQVIPDDISLFNMLNDIKQTLDPNGVMAPGKYTIQNQNANKIDSTKGSKARR